MTDNDINRLIAIMDKKSSSMQRLEKWQKKPYKIFYKIFVPKSTRRAWQKNADIAQQDYLANCFSRLISLYFNNQFAQFHIKPKQTFNHQKIIWQYWGQGIDVDLPEVVKLSFASIDKYKGDYQVIRLDDNSVHDYLELPDFIWKKRNNPEFKHAFFADLLRLALLHSYGGIWADATILLTAPIDDKIKSQDFFMFQRSDAAPNQALWHSFNADYFSWQDNHHVNVLNSFIVAKKDNAVIYHCLNILLNFWRNQNHITHYFFFQIMFDVLIKEFIPEHNCPIIDDTLPHLLIARINDAFDTKSYDAILQKINIHKLTYINHPKDNSYYQHLVTTYIK